MLRRMLCVGVLFLSGTAAQALFDAEAFYGMRQYRSRVAGAASFESLGTGPSVGVNPDPLPFIPLSVGASYSAMSLDEKILTRKARITNLGLDVKAWVPLISALRPYGRLHYILDSKLSLEASDGSFQYSKLSGFSVSLGLAYKLFPGVNALLEGSQAFETLAPGFAGSKQSFRSQALMLGLQVGI